MSQIPGRTFLDANQVVLVPTFLITLAELNAGGKLLIPGVAGQQLELVDILWLNTGTFTGLSSAVITTTEPTTLFTVAAADMVDGSRLSPLSTNPNTAAAFWAPLAMGAGIRVSKIGGAAAGGTSITVRISYKVVKPS